MKLLSILEFWKSTYLPHVERNAKPSTVHGYKKLWECYLAGELGGKTLSEFRTADATRFLTQLSEKGLGARTVAHARSLASGIFRHAVRLGLLSVNPWRDAGSLTRPNKPEETTAYTLQEIQQMLGILTGESRLALALAALQGLRPGEIAGLRHEDVQGDWLSIERSVWRGVISSTKTKGSTDRIPLLPSVKEMLEQMPKKNGWVLSERGGPKDMDEFSRHHIAKPLRSRGIEFKGLYAARRACSTILTQLTNSPFIAQRILRHTNAHTTLSFYIKMNGNDLALQGMKALGAAIGDQKALAAGAQR